MMRSKDNTKTDDLRTNETTKNKNLRGHFNNRFPLNF